MERDEMLLQLDDVLDLQRGTLTGTEELESLEQWDSLAMMNFIAMASDQFGLNLSPRQIAASGTVNDLLAMLNGKSERA
jgi:acyl carrier protein